MNAEEKYPLLIGHSLAGRTRLHNIQEVANFICTHGQYDDIVITERDGTFPRIIAFNNRITIYIKLHNKFRIVSPFCFIIVPS